jgi:hypothetical protein
LQQAAELSPNEPTLFYPLGTVLLQLGSTEQARRSKTPDFGSGKLKQPSLAAARLVSEQMLESLYKEKAALHHRG